ncbi:MAG TPA: 2-dehydro-3-deoxygalactonokinase [Noviherbaspirillum sp.]|nr:2-dehydro-3-deoxygalactonokinase [Noviherbaspirillum sp.]
MGAELIVGIDWGTSNRRAYVLDARGALLRRHEDAMGILSVEGDYRGSLQALLARLEVERGEVLMSGMVGSRNGWHQVPYLSTSAPLTALAEALFEVPDAPQGLRCRIVPGYSHVDSNGLPDVMRGEETQLLGALALGAEQGASGWFLLPGTHSKWANVDNGRIVEFFTYMTGELYALLTTHGTLARVAQADESVSEAFAAGLQAARHGSFSHLAFCCRALVVTDAMPASHTTSWLSGLLIGSELYDILRRVPSGMPQTVQVVGSPALARRYMAALELLGIPARTWEPDEVYLAALRILAGLPR